MTKFFLGVIKQPFWLPLLIAGVVMCVLPGVTIGKSQWITPHKPEPIYLIYVGLFLIVSSIGLYTFDKISQNLRAAESLASVGLDATVVKKVGDTYVTRIGDCELVVAFGRIEEFDSGDDTVVVLPCNEYLDRNCIIDGKTSLGAYVRRRFSGRVDDFADHVGEVARPHLISQQSNADARIDRNSSFGPGRALVLPKALGTSQTIALVSTATQRPGEGIVSRISYMFDASRDLALALADMSTPRELLMPLLGAGRGGISSPLAFVGLVLALAELAKYLPEARKYRKITVVVFRVNDVSSPEVDPVVVQRALALVGS